MGRLHPKNVAPCGALVERGSRRVTDPPLRQFIGNLPITRRGGFQTRPFPRPPPHLPKNAPVGADAHIGPFPRPARRPQIQSRPSGPQPYSPAPRFNGELSPQRLRGPTWYALISQTPPPRTCPSLGRGQGVGRFHPKNVAPCGALIEKGSGRVTDPPLRQFMGNLPITP